MKLIRHFYNILVITLVITLSISFTMAAVITDDIHLNIQTTFDNGTITTGTFDFVFNISTTSTCDNIIYTNSTTLLTDTRGIISYYLPSVTLDYDEQYYLCYYRDGALKDSSKIARTPYSFRAQNITLSGVEIDQNLDMGAYNVTTTGTGFFGFLGSLTSRISKLFVTDLDFSGEVIGIGNITTTGNITADNFFGNFTGTMEGNTSTWSRAGTDVFLTNIGDNVGIGTDNPLSALNVIGDGNFTGDLYASKISLSNTGINEPVISFGDGDTGFGERYGDDVLGVFAAGSVRFWFAAGGFYSSDSSGPRLKSAGATSYYPSIEPSRGDIDTGIGWAGEDTLSLVAGGVNGLNINETGGIARVGIGTTDPQNTLNVIGDGNFTGNVTFGGDFLRGSEATSGAILNEGSSSTNPTIVPNQGETGYGLGYGSQSIHLIADSINVAEFNSSSVNITQDMTVQGSLTGVVAGSYGFVNVQSTSTVPTILPNKGETGYGIGYGSSSVNIIAGDTNILELTSSQITGWKPANFTSNVTFGSVSGNFLSGNIVKSGAILNEETSSTNPTIIPNQEETSYGLGYGTSSLHLIANDENVVEVTDSEVTFNENVVVDGNVTADNFFGNFTGTMEGNTSTWSRAGTDVFLTNSGDSVGIGTDSPSYDLDVVGNINIDNNSAYLYDGFTALRLDKGTDAVYANTFVGDDAGTLGLTKQTAVGYRAGDSSSGANQVAIGYFAGSSNTGEDEVAIGYYAGVANSGANQVAIGNQAGRVNSGVNQLAIGAYAGFSNTGTYMTSVGNYAGRLNIGNYLTSVGQYAGYGNEGDKLTAVGYYAGQLQTGDNVIGIGADASKNNTGNQVSAIGYEAGENNKGNDVVAIGYQAGKNNVLDDQFIVQQANVNAVPLIQGDFSSGNVGIGTTSPQNTLNVIGDGNFTGGLTIPNDQTYKFGGDDFIEYFETNNSFGVGKLAGSDTLRSLAIGDYAGYQNIGIRQTVIGYQAGFENEGLGQSALGYWAGYQNTGSSQSAVGYFAGHSNTGDNQVVMGLYTGHSNTGSLQLAIGYYAGYGNEGNNQVAIGSQAGRYNTGSSQSAIGYQAGYQNSGVYQSAIGYETGRLNTGTYQTAMGYQAGYNNTGDSGVFIGHEAGENNILDNQFILKMDNVNAVPLIQGDFSSGYLGVGTTSPQNTLNVIGDGNFTGGLTIPNDQTYKFGGDDFIEYFETNKSFGVGKLSGSDTQYSLGIGYYAGYLNTGTNQVAIGYRAGYENEGYGQSAIGFYTGYQNTGTFQSAIGVNAGRSNTGNYQSAIGNQAGQLNEGGYQTAMGYLAGYENTGDYQAAIGSNAGHDNTGHRVTGLGAEATRNNTGDDVVALGYEAGENNVLDDQFIVQQANVNAVPLIQGDFSSGNVSIAGNVTASNFFGTFSGNTSTWSRAGTDVFLTNIGDNVGIGTDNPGEELEVIGSIKSTNFNWSDSLKSTVVGSSTGDILTQTTLLGYQTGFSNTGAYSSGVGYQALAFNSGTYSNAFGIGALHTNTGTGSNAVGYRAGYKNTGSLSTFFGHSSGSENTGASVSLFGYQAGFENIGESLVSIGYNSGYKNTGAFVTSIGYNAGYLNTGLRVTGISYQAGYNNTGDDGVFIGYEAGENNVLDDQFIVQQANVNAVPLIQGDFSSGNVSIAGNVTASNFFGTFSGNTSTWSRAGTDVFLTNTGDSVGIGTDSPDYKLEVDGQIYSSNFRFNDTLKSLSVGTLSGNPTSQSTYFGYLAGDGNTGNDVTAVGYRAGDGNTGGRNVLIGTWAGYSSPGVYSVGVGYQALNHNEGQYVTAVGYRAGGYQLGNSIVAFGSNSAYQNEGFSVTAIGGSSAFRNSGNSITVFGYEAGYNNTGDDVVAIGYQAGYYNNDSNQFIVQQANVNAVPLIQGDFSSGNVSIAGNVTGNWFNGLFNWTTDTWSDFNGYNLTFNESKLDELLLGDVWFFVTETVVYGTPEGSLTSTQQYNNYDAVTYNLTEVVPQGLEYYANTTANVSSEVNRICVRYISDNEDFDLAIWDTGGYWEDYITFRSGETFRWACADMRDASDHLIDDKIMIKITHNNGANVQHKLRIDAMYVSSGYTPKIGNEVDPLSFHMHENINHTGYNITSDYGFFEKVGINTTTPQNTLNVIGDGNFTGGLTIPNDQTYKFGGDDFIEYFETNNSFGVGKSAGSDTLISLAIGYYAGYQNTGTYQTAIGYQAGKSNTGTIQTAIGYYAGNSNTGINQVVIGHSAGYQNTGSSQSALGYNAGRQNSGAYQSAIGYLAGRENTGSFQTVIGYYAGYLNTGHRVTGIGYYATQNNTGDDVVALGYQAGLNNVLDDQFIVQQANVNAVPLIQGDFSSGNVSIAGNVTASNFFGTFSGNTSTWSRAGTDVFLTNSGDNVGIGTDNPSVKLEVSQSVDGKGIQLNGYDDKSAENVQMYVNSVGQGIIMGTNALTFVGNSALILRSTGGNINFDTGDVFYWRDSDDGYTQRMRLASATGVLDLWDSSLNNNVRINPNGNSYINSGNVGINTSTPQNTLNVIGDGNFTGNFSVDNTDLFVDSSTGNVGIGTSTPTRNLDLFESGGGSLHVRFSNDDTGVGSSDGVLFGMSTVEELIFWNYEDTNMRFATNGLERMRIDNTGNVGINTLTPQNTLNVIGDGNFTGGLTIPNDQTYKFGGDDFIEYFETNNSFGIGKLAGSDTLYSLAIGYQAGFSNTGNRQIAIGYQAGLSNTGNQQSAVGYRTGQANTGFNQAALGAYSGYLNTGDYQSAIGYYAGYQNNGTSQVAIGYYAGYDNKADYQSVFGLNAGRENEGVGQSAIGYYAGYSNIGSNQVVFGPYSGHSNTGINQVAIGYQAGYSNQGAYQSTIGFRAGYSNEGSNAIGIGYEAGRLNTGHTITGIGYQAGYNNTGDDVVALGYQAGLNNVLSNQFIVQQANVNAVPLIQGDFSSGNVSIAGNVTASNFFGTFSGNTSTWSRAGTDVFLTNSGDNVGIGTDNPQSLLNLNGTLGSLSGGLTFGDGDTGFYESLDDRLNFVLGGVAKFALKNNRYFGSNVAYGGSLKAEAPTLASLTITFEGDENTGIATAIDGTPDQLSLVAGGVEGIRIDETGGVARVGINTTTPQNTLNVIGDGNFTGNFSVDNTDLFVDSSTGNVGIGTSSPEDKLHIIDTTSGNNIQIFSIEGNQGEIKMKSDDLYDRMSFGLVHNTIPTSGRGVFYTSISGETYARFNFDGVGKLGWGAGSTDIDVDLYRDSADKLRTSDTLIVDGNVGIGTDNPERILHISGSDNIRSRVDTTSNDGSAGFLFNAPANGSDSQLNFATHSDGYAAVPNYAGKGGIQSSGGNLFLTAYTPSTDIEFYVGGRTDSHLRMILKDGGNIGINTATPQNTLNVIGDGNFTGNVTSQVDFCIEGGNCLSSVSGSGSDATWLANWTAYNTTWSSGGDVTWLANWTAYNTTWSSTTNTSYALVNEPLWSSNYTAYNNSWSQGSTWVSNWTAYNTTWSSTTNTSYVPYTGANTNLVLGDNNLSVGGTDFFVNNNDGNVGIGTDNPDTILHLKDSDTHITLQSTGVLDASYGYTIVKDGNGDTIGFSGFDSGSNSDYTIRTTDVADGIEFQTNGSNSRMYINQAGNVGIGTDSPDYNLEIEDATAQIGLTSTDTNGIPFRFLSDDDGSQGRFRLREEGVSASTIMTWLENQNIGIGTDIPGTKLEVNGDIGIGRIAGGYTFRETVGGVERAGIHSDATNELIFKYGAAAEGMRIDSAGNVGIGTDSPGDLLELKKTTAAPNLILNRVQELGDDYSVGGIQFKAKDSTVAAIYSHISGTIEDSAVLLFVTSTGGSISEQMRIDKDGNVGIGTTSPGLNLFGSTGDMTGLTQHIYNSGGNANLVMEGDSVNVIYGDLGGGADDKGILFNVNGGIAKYTSLTDAIGTRVDNILVMDLGTGNVGIGTSSPEASLSIKAPSASNTPGASRLLEFREAGGAGSDWFSFRETAGADLVLDRSPDAGSSWYAIMHWDVNTGNVGIGTTSPQNTLNVIGDGNFTGTIYSNENAVLTSYTETDPYWTGNKSLVAFLGEAETITADWDNTANPWAVNEVHADLLTATEGDAAYAPIGEPLWSANYSARTGTGDVVFSTSPTFVTGITVPANSISDDELNEGATFEWTAAHTFSSTAPITMASGTDIRWVDTGTYIDGTATGMVIESDDTLAMNADTSVTITSPASSFSGDLTVTGGDITFGGTAISESDVGIIDDGTITLTSEVTGTLPVANGGTGLTASVEDSIMVGSGTSTWQTKAIPDCTSGKLLYTVSSNTFSCGTDAIDGGDANLLDGLDATHFYNASNPEGYTSNTGDITGITTTAGTSGLNGGCTSGTCALTFDATDVDGTGLTGSGSVLSVDLGTAIDYTEITVMTEANLYTLLNDVTEFWENGDSVTGAVGANEVWAVGWDGDTSVPEKDDIYDWASGVTTTEMDYLQGVSSDIQTQINTKGATLTDEASLYATLSDVTEFYESGDKVGDADTLDTMDSLDFVAVIGDTMTGDLRIDKADATIYFDTSGTGDAAIRVSGEDLQFIEPEDGNKVWGYFDDDVGLYLTGAPNLNAAGTGTFGGDLVVDTSDLFVDSSTSRVGIGTDSPLNPLHVIGTTNVSGGDLYVDGGDKPIVIYGGYYSAFSDGTIIRMMGMDGTKMLLGPVEDTDAELQIYVGGGYKHSFDIDGKVGINTITPQNILNVVGDGNFTGNFSVDNTDLFVDTSTNRVGIGTANPTEKLHVVGSQIIDPNAAAVGLKIFGDSTFRATFYQDANDIFNIYNYDEDAPAIADLNLGKSSGNAGLYYDASADKWGIGTNSPNALLSLSSAGGANMLSLTDTETTETAANPILSFYYGATPTRLGYIGFGSESHSDLFLNSDLAGIRMRDSTGEVFYINNGNVGIGDTTPLSRLRIGNSGTDASTYSVYIHDGDNTGIYSYGTTYGVYGSGGTTGVYGIGTATGVYGDGNTGMYGTGTTYGVYGDGGTADFYSPHNTYGFGSSIRWKENITEINSQIALDKILNIEGSYFNWKDTGNHDIGFIAEELGKIVPEAIIYENASNSSNWYIDKNGTKMLYATGVRSGYLTPILVQATKGQQELIISQNNTINQLLLDNQAMKKSLCNLGAKEWC